MDYNIIEFKSFVQWYPTRQDGCTVFTKLCVCTCRQRVAAFLPEIHFSGKTHEYVKYKWKKLQTQWSGNVVPIEWVVSMTSSLQSGVCVMFVSCGRLFGKLI